MTRVAAQLLLGPLAACSVGTAMSGKQSPNLGAVQRGVTRGEVEMDLGHAVQATAHPDGTAISTYHHEVGNDPSAGRTRGAHAMDVLTLGQGEIVSTPVEGVQGKKCPRVVTYAAEGTVQKVATQKIGG